MYVQLLALGCIFWGCTNSEDVTDKEDVTEEEDTILEEQQEEVLLNLEPGVNELILEQEVEGEIVERRFYVHLPNNYDGTGSTPLFFAFHGAGGTGELFIQQFAPTIEAGDFIGVYPNGIANSWNIGREESKADDVEFTYMILDVLKDADGIDITKPVGMGFSNGAALVHKIGIESDLFVAIVPQVSQLTYENQPQSDGAKISVMQFMGTNDDICPYDGGVGVLGHDFMPAEESAAIWAAHNECDEIPIETQLGEHLVMEWENCSENRRVMHYRLNGFGHEVPPNIDGGTNQLLIDFLLESRQ